MAQAHWRHVACGPEQEEGFECARHHRRCRKIWVRESQGSPDALLTLEREQVRHQSASEASPAGARRQKQSPESQARVAQTETATPREEADREQEDALPFPEAEPEAPARVDEPAERERESGEREQAEPVQLQLSFEPARLSHSPLARWRRRRRARIMRAGAWGPRGWGREPISKAVKRSA